MMDLSPGGNAGGGQAEFKLNRISTLLSAPSNQSSRPRKCFWCWLSLSILID